MTEGALEPDRARFLIAVVLVLAGAVAQSASAQTQGKAPAAEGALQAPVLAPQTTDEDTVEQEAAAARAVLDPGAPEGAVLTDRSERDFDRYPVPIGPFARDGANVRIVEGRVVRSAYRLDDPKATTAEVARLYRERLVELGYTINLDCVGAGCGGLAFRFAVELLPPPAMLVDAADFAQISADRDLGKAGAAHASILVSRALDSVYVQVVMVTPAAPSRNLVASPVTEAEPTAPVAPGDAEELLERLRQNGHVVLNGVRFETGGAKLAPASDSTLEAVAILLKDHPDLKVVIVGHSDNTGSLESNIALSKKRAEAVRAALIARGVAGGQLAAEGVGFLAPVTSNATEEGRARNRRVDLVLR